MKKADLMKIPLKYFGIPSLRKYPMHDEAHLKAAITYFYSAKKKYRSELARNIIRRYSELKSNLKISKKNPLYKYIPDNMKDSNESLTESMFSPEVVNTLNQYFPNKSDKTMLEMLIKNNKIIDVDDIDDAVPYGYDGRDNLINITKYTIMENAGYPIAYSDFPVLSGTLSVNNGGITDTAAYMYKYDNSLNEACDINPIRDSEHVEFATILREWNESYVNGDRNIIYDRLLIENWIHRVNILRESYESSDFSDPLIYQKLLDLGISDTDDVYITSDIQKTRSDSIKSKFKELHIPGTITLKSCSTSGNVITLSTDVIDSKIDDDTDDAHVGGG